MPILNTKLDTIQTRPPTGIVPWPCILVEGEEGSGKSYAAAKLTASPLVGRSFWVDLNEGAADEYGPIGDYEVVTHDGTWRSFFGQVRAIHAFAAEQAKAGEKPVVLVIDSMTAEWDWLKDWIGTKAAQSNQNKALLAKDPNAEIRIPNHLWNDANAKHRNLMRLLMTFEGIVILTARGKEVAVIRDGRPVEGEKKWKPETQNGVPGDVTAWITMRREAPAQLIKVRSLYIGQKPGHGEPMDLTSGESEWEERGLEWFIFDAMRCNPGKANARDLVKLDRDNVDDGLLTLEDAMTAVREGWKDIDALRRVYDAAEESGILDQGVDMPDGTQRTLRSIVDQQARFLMDAQESAPAQGDEQASTAQESAQEPAQETPAAQPEPAQETAQETAPVHDQPREVKLTKAQERAARQDAQIREEAQFQADVLNADVNVLIEKISASGKVHLGKANRALVGARPDVIAALRELGSATVADRYEAIKDGFPINIASVTDEPETADAAQEASA